MSPIFTLMREFTVLKTFSCFNESFFQLIACGNRGQSTIECYRYDVGEKWTYFNSIEGLSHGERDSNDPFVAVSLDIGILAFSGGTSRRLPKNSTKWESGPIMTNPNHSDKKLNFSHSCAVAISGQSLVRNLRSETNIQNVANNMFQVMRLF